MFKYKFSVIIAVYNVVPFLKEAVESLVCQDIGFLENVQVILVDDGSVDGSAGICDLLHEQYPQNIVAVHKKNGGVSSARNEGLLHVEGEFVSFLDGDDKMSEGSLSAVYKSFKRWPTAKIATIPLVFFEGQQGPHILNNKFEKGTRLIDVSTEYQYPLLSLSASFVTNETAVKLCFDEQLSIAEDAKIIMQILLDSPQYIVVKEATYWYRRRLSGGSSAIQGATYNKAWYLNYMQNFVLWSMDACKTIYHEVLPFVQYTLMYDLQWRYRLGSIPENVLTQEELLKFRNSLKQAISNIDDSVIMNQKNLMIEHKLFVLKEKYGTAPERRIENGDFVYYYGDKQVYQYSQTVTKLDFISIRDNILDIEGLSMFYDVELFDETEWFLKVNDDLIPCKIVNRTEAVKSLDTQIAQGIGFSASVALSRNKTTQITLVNRIKDVYVERTKICFGKFSPLQSEMWNSYYADKNYILSYSYNKLIVEPYCLKNYLHKEFSYLKGLLKKKAPAAYKAFILRCFYMLRRNFPQKECWLISDRINKADDNGEMFFRYMQAHPDKEINCYFAISKDCEEYHRLKQYGKVIPFGGWLYKWLYICGARIVSSQGEDYVYRPLQDSSVYYSDLIQKSRFVFLQHGVIKDDLSRWLNRYAKNIHMFVTTTHPEYDSVLSYNYYYGKDVVQLTGLPRHDRLYHDEKNYITIMPTWRAYLVGNIQLSDGKRPTLPFFLDSQYYSMYTELLTDTNLMQILKQSGYKIRFLSHPNMAETVKLFSFDSSVEILAPSEPYRKIFAETKLLITDYSSVAFDFSYLRKPTLYFQADYEEFFSGKHTYGKGYFDYEKDGFGEVAYSAREMSEKIIEYIKTDCKLKDQYAARINRTFPFSDQDNAKRVYEKIKQIK